MYDEDAYLFWFYGVNRLQNALKRLSIMNYEISTHLSIQD